MILEHFVLPGLNLLPEKMDSLEARVLMVAIGLQESRFQHRFQIGGPARGFWQFERGGGVRGVLQHHTTHDTARRVCGVLRIPADTDACYDAIAFNDALAGAFARLLIWTVPKPIPIIGRISDAWDYYIEGWHPGTPHRETWGDLYRQAICIVERGAA
jgi:hypothetical protein